MKKDKIKKMTLSLGIVFIPIGVILIINDVLSYASHAKMKIGYMVAVIGFVNLSVYFLYKSKDLMQRRKGLSAFLKVIAIYWIVLSCLISLAIIFT